MMSKSVGNYGPKKTENDQACYLLKIKGYKIFIIFKTNLAIVYGVSLVGPILCKQQQNSLNVVFLNLSFPTE